MSGAVLICTLSVLVLSANQIAVFHSAKVESLTFHVFNNLLTAVFEEVLYRVVLFLGMIQFFNSPGLRFWKVTALTSFIFAALHFMNIIRLDFNIYTAFTQVVFAFGFGFLLQVLYVVSRNILIPIALHFLVNFFGTSSRLDSPEGLAVPGGNPDLTSLLFLFIFCAVLISLSVLLYRERDFERFKEALV